MEWYNYYRTIYVWNQHLYGCWNTKTTVLSTNQLCHSIPMGSISIIQTKSVRNSAFYNSFPKITISVCIIGANTTLTSYHSNDKMVQEVKILHKIIITVLHVQKQSQGNGFLDMARCLNKSRQPSLNLISCEFVDMLQCP